MKKCPNCNAMLDDEVIFCSNCGSRFPYMPDPSGKPPKGSSKKGLKWLFIVIPVIVLLAAAGVITVLVLKGSNKSAEALIYLKGDELTSAGL